MKQQFIGILLFAVIFWVKSDADTITFRRPCPLIRCIAQNCENGYIVNIYGCQTCECNPCKFGQPLFKFPCGQGQSQCTANKDLCKISNFDNAYCCPNERLGCCPPVPFPQTFMCIEPDCTNDTDCKVGEKCCRPCSRCTNATLT